MHWNINRIGIGTFIEELIFEKNELNKLLSIVNWLIKISFLPGYGDHKMINHSKYHIGKIA